MKTISRWASQNILLSRWLIFLFCTLANTMGAIIGFLLFVDFISLHFIWEYVLILFLCVLTWLYPMKNKRNYCQTKVFSFGLYFTVFMLYVLIGNQVYIRINHFPELSSGLNIQTASVASFINISTETKKVQKNQKKSWKKELRQKIKEQIRILRKQDKTARVGAVLLILLITLLLLGVVAILSCSLACNGSNTAAVLVLLGGVGLVIWCTIYLIRADTAKQKNKQKLQQTG